MKTSDRGRSRSARVPRLEDVARLASVSKTTASRALSDSDLVTDETKKKVKSAAEQLDYRLNSLARAMSAGHTQTIGLVIADISNSFFDRATTAIIDTAARRNYQVLVINTNESLEAEVNAVRVLLEKRVDGLIVVPSSPDQYAHLLVGERPAAPVVLLDRQIAGLPVGSVSTDDYASSLEAVRLLASRGHTRIGALVNTSDDRVVDERNRQSTVSTIFDRVVGFMDGMREHGLEPNQDWIRYVRPDHDKATESALGLLSMRPRPTALLTSNSDAALAALDAANQLHIPVGPKLSIISFDDAPWARVIQPSLTVVDRPVYQLGESAVELLLDEIRSGHSEARSLVMKNSLVLRESVGFTGPPIPRITADAGTAAASR